MLRNLVVFLALATIAATSQARASWSSVLGPPASTAPSATRLGGTDAALAAAGLPPRPIAAADSARYQTWSRVIRSARTPLAATFILQTRRSPKRVYQPDWAGPVLFAPGARPMQIPRHRFRTIEGEWTVPFAKPTINCSNPLEPTDGSSLWIALDG